MDQINWSQCGPFAGQLLDEIVVCSLQTTENWQSFKCSKKTFSTCPWSKPEETRRNSSEQMLYDREKSMSYLNTHNCYSALSYKGPAIAGIT